ncbi:long-chain fatty acid transporter [Agrobacterium rubi]|nr:outer membrane protein transport protein [Agrobacterium rubi]MCL6654076.1 long-chain fatty acid transporter [Agrobacterium rubi]
MNSRKMEYIYGFILSIGLVTVSPLAASAGGFSRGEANTDILFGDARFSTESSVIYVSPNRSYSSIMGQSVDESAYSNSFAIPSVSLGMRLGDNLSCALTYTQPFGASGTYSEAAQNAEFLTALAAGSTFPNPTSKMKFYADEYGATCGIRLDAGPGRLHFIGGMFLETFDYKEDTLIGSVHLKDDGQLGYRAGIAYDIPEYAMRVQLLYRSQVEHEADGTYTPSAFGIANGIPTDLPAKGAGTLPQSLKLSAQTGVAPGWLVYGSAAWTDWSVLPGFSYDVTGLGTSSKVFNYKDGYTLQMGVGHEFTDKVSGTVNLTWDRGVGTGADITTDTWTLGLGTQYKGNFGTVGVGAALSYLTAGSQNASSGATYDATANADWAFAVGVTYALQF